MSRKQRCPESYVRKNSITPEAVTRVLGFIEQGICEKLSAIRAGVSPDAWKMMKSRNPDIRLRIDAAKAIAGERKYQQIMIERLEAKKIRQRTALIIITIPKKDICYLANA
jgi:hypothetical protein